MKIDIATDHTKLHPHPLGPHFWRSHDKNVVEDRDGELQDALDLDQVVRYLDEEPEDPELREAMNLVFGNCGLCIRWGMFDAGERAVGKLFVMPRDKDGKNRGENFTGQGERFTMLLLEHVAKVLEGCHSDGTEQGKKIYGHIERFVKEAGLEPNIDRIKAEFCPTCGKGA